MNEYMALVEWFWQGLPKYCKKKIFALHFYIKSHVDCLVTTPDLCGDRLEANHLIDGTGVS
jgi:hypothetical protein